MAMSGDSGLEILSGPGTLTPGVKATFVVNGRQAPVVVRIGYVDGNLFLGTHRSSRGVVEEASGSFAPTTTKLLKGLLFLRATGERVSD